MRRLPALSVVAVAGLTMGYWSPALAGCGLDPVCAVSEAIARGAGGGAAEGLRPLVTNVMEREAPQLINTLQSAIDLNIITARDAGETLIIVAVSVMDRAAKDVTDHVAQRTEDVVKFTADRVDATQTKFMSNVGKLLDANWDQAHCFASGINLMFSDQRQVLDSDLQHFFRIFHIGGRSQAELEDNCRAALGLEDLSMNDLDLPSRYKVWRCIRISGLYDERRRHPFSAVSSSAIEDAYIDSDAHGLGVVCALHGAPSAALQQVVEIWSSDEQNAKLWEWARGQ